MNNKFKISKNRLIVTKSISLNKFHKQVFEEILNNHKCSVSRCREHGFKIPDEGYIEFRETWRNEERNKLEEAARELKSIGVLTDNNDSWHYTMNADINLIKALNRGLKV